MVLYSVMIGSCFLVMLARFDLSFSWSLLGKFLYYSSFGLLSNIFLAFLTAGLALLFQSWVVPVSVLFPLLIGLSRLLATFIKEAKYLPDLATLNLFEYEGLQQSIDLSGLGIQLLWLALVWSSAIFLTLKRDVR